MKRRKRKEVAAVITVEMSLVFPVVLGILSLLLHTIFYYHDKNILIGAAAETAVVGAQIERKPDERGQINLIEVYQQRIGEKLILFPESSAECEITDKKVTVEASAAWKHMKLTVEQSAPVLHPERVLRDKKIISSMTEQ